MLSLNSLNITTPNKNPNQNFGFKVKVLENSKLVDMADSYLFREQPKSSIELFEAKAASVLPDRTVVLKHKIRRPKPFECFDVDFYTNGKKTDYIIDYDSHALLTYLNKAVNKYTKIHSRLFYNGEQSPEMLQKVAKSKETNLRPFNRFRNNNTAK